MEELKLVVPNNFKDRCIKVNNHINDILGTNNNYIVDLKLNRFSNGEGKSTISESLRGTDVYILSDISNYDVTYKCQRGIHHMMPDEHMQDIKRIINSINGQAKKITLKKRFK